MRSMHSTSKHPPSACIGISLYLPILLLEEIKLQDSTQKSLLRYQAVAFNFLYDDKLLDKICIRGQAPSSKDLPPKP